MKMKKKSEGAKKWRPLRVEPSERWSHSWVPRFALLRCVGTDFERSGSEPEPVVGVGPRSSTQPFSDGLGSG